MLGGGPWQEKLSLTTMASVSAAGESRLPTHTWPALLSFTEPPAASLRMGHCLCHCLPPTPSQSLYPANHSVPPHPTLPPATSRNLVIWLLQIFITAMLQHGALSLVLLLPHFKKQPWCCCWARLLCSTSAALWSICINGCIRSISSTDAHTIMQVQRQTKVRLCFAATGLTNFLVEDKPLPIPSLLSTYISWTSHSLPIAHITFSYSFNESYTTLPLLVPLSSINPLLFIYSVSMLPNILYSLRIWHAIFSSSSSSLIM